MRNLDLSFIQSSARSEAHEDSTTLLHISVTNLDLTVIKFGYHSVFEILEEKCMKAMNDLCLESNLCPFFIVASYTDERHVLCNHSNHPLLHWV